VYARKRKDFGRGKEKTKLKGRGGVESVEVFSLEYTLSPVFFPMYITLQFNFQSTLLWTLYFERGQRDPTAANSNESEYTLSPFCFFFKFKIL